MYRRAPASRQTSQPTFVSVGHPSQFRQPEIERYFELQIDATEQKELSSTACRPAKTPCLVFRLPLDRRRYVASLQHEATGKAIVAGRTSRYFVPC